MALTLDRRSFAVYDAATATGRSRPAGSSSASAPPRATSGGDHRRHRVRDVAHPGARHRRARSPPRPSSAVLLGRPVPEPRPLFPLHEDSTIHDLRQVALGRPLRARCSVSSAARSTSATPTPERGRCWMPCSARCRCGRSSRARAGRSPSVRSTRCCVSSTSPAGADAERGRPLDNSVEPHPARGRGWRDDESDLWDAETAARYDETSAFMFAPEVLDPAVDVPRGPGRGRHRARARRSAPAAWPSRSSSAACRSSGIELSQPMADQLHAKRPRTSRSSSVTWRRPPCPASSRWSTWCGTASATCAPRPSRSPASATPPATSPRAAGSSSSCGCPASDASRPARPRCRSTSASTTSGFDTFDLVTQQGTSHHYTPRARRLGALRRQQLPLHLAGRVRPDGAARRADARAAAAATGTAAPFTGDSESHVSVWRAPA